MANFDKFGNLSRQGWDEKAGAQTIKIGESAHIGLFGGGPPPANADLVVTSDKPTVCVVHEEPRPQRADWRHFLLTALQDGDATINAVIPGTTTVYASMTVHVVGHAGVRLVFFPGEQKYHDAVLDRDVVAGTIYVIGGNGEAIRAAGGPMIGYKDRGGHTAEQTPPGRYKLGPKMHVIAPSWTTSAIPWGANLRINKGEVEYQDDSGRGSWIPVTGRNGVMTKAHYNFQHRDGKKITFADADKVIRNVFIDPATGTLRLTIWEHNDFGRWGWNLLQNGKGTAYFVHTTPNDESTTKLGRAVHLANSHGCIHLKPADRDDFIGKGYLKEGVDFEVRPYTETGPP